MQSYALRKRQKKNIKIIRKIKIFTNRHKKYEINNFNRQSIFDSIIVMQFFFYFSLIPHRFSRRKIRELKHSKLAKKK